MTHVGVLREGYLYRTELFLASSRSVDFRMYSTAAQSVRLEMNRFGDN